MRDDNCLFCKIVGGDIPSNKLYEDELCYAFYDIAPQAPTHFLVIPKSHIGSVAEISGENSAVVAHIFEVIAKLTKELGLYDLTPAMCRLDYTMSEAGETSDFVREYTLASGGPYCDCGYHKKQ